MPSVMASASARTVSAGPACHFTSSGLRAIISGGGLTNPLGARALYIYQDGKDTGYRIHGSPEWWSIGQAMSSGCVRLINQDIIDLYSRVSKKNPVVVV
ncbi:L,D-transpeptidase, partial [Mesorhizobium sp. M7A.F.Ca.AU.001.01.1.1]